MSDLFHEDVPVEFIARITHVMEQASWHTFQVLTKRAARMQELLSGPLQRVAEARHVWWGVSVEDRKFGVPRIEALRQTSATVRFLSVEPLLEDLGPLDLNGIDWVIVGGESGPHSRPIRLEWVESILDQCRRQGVAFFFKQWGGTRKKASGRTLHGRTYDEMPAAARVVV
jgi:protein gp37